MFYSPIYIFLCTVLVTLARLGQIYYDFDDSRTLQYTPILTCYMINFFWSIPHLFFHNEIALPELNFIFNSIPSGRKRIFAHAGLRLWNAFSLSLSLSEREREREMFVVADQSKGIRMISKRICLIRHFFCFFSQQYLLSYFYSFVYNADAFMRSLSF